MQIAIFITLVVVVAIRTICAVERLRKCKRLWAAYALALEVSLECKTEYHEKIDGEGCMTRHRRRERAAQQLANAQDAAFAAQTELTQLGEYV
jgi:cobalamin biosynthesis protein CobD/CbiB